MIGHGAASEELGAVVLDYIHNLVSAVWIGGIIYFVFTLLPTFSQLKEITDREKMSLLVMIPRFSIAFHYFNRNCNNYWANFDVVLGKRCGINH